MLKNTYRILFLFMMLISISSNLYAQYKVTHTNQQWIQFYHSHTISSKFTFNYDVGIRKVDDNAIAVALARFSVGYNLGKNFTAATGIANFNTLNDFNLTRLELRPFQELALKKLNFNRIKITNRFRTEYRYFINYNDNNANTIVHNWRFRYRLGIKGVIADLKNNNKVCVSLANELFVNSGKNIKYNYLDNNRVIAGLSLENQKIAYGINYVYQYGHRASINTAEQSDIIWLTISLKTSVLK